MKNLIHRHANDDVTFSEHGSDKQIVQLIIVYDIQIFMTANFKLSRNYNKKISFLYLDPKSHRIDIKAYLGTIMPLKLENNTKNQCNTYKMLFGNIFFEQIVFRRVE